METPDPAPTPEHPFAAILRFVVILATLGVTALLGLGLLSRPLDGEAKVREYFGGAALPFGLALEGSQRIDQGTVVRLVPEPGHPEAPEEVLLVETSGRSSLEKLFRPSSSGEHGDAGTQLREWQRDQAFAWHTTIKRGEIDWGALSAKLQVERAFREGGGWLEQARVDVSTPERPLALIARWPLETPVDEAALRTILRGLVLELDEG